MGNKSTVIRYFSYRSQPSSCFAFHTFPYFSTCILHLKGHFKNPHYSSYPLQLHLPNNYSYVNVRSIGLDLKFALSCLYFYPAWPTSILHSNTFCDKGTDHIMLCPSIAVITILSSLVNDPNINVTIRYKYSIIPKSSLITRAHISLFTYFIHTHIIKIFS